jgi:hypothetical protein
VTAVKMGETLRYTFHTIRRSAKAKSILLGPAALPAVTPIANQLLMTAAVTE